MYINILFEYLEVTQVCYLGPVAGKTCIGHLFPTVCRGCRHVAFLSLYGYDIYIYI